MERQLHILFISSWYPSEDHPFLGNFVRRHAELIARRHLVTVLDLRSDGSTGDIVQEYTKDGNLQEILVRYPAGSNTVTKWHNARKAFRKTVAQIYGVDLIHGHVILGKGFQFIWAKKHFGKPLIVSEHASYYREEARRQWSLKDKMILRKVMRAADCLTAVSPFLAEEIHHAFPGKHIEIFPNVIDPARFPFAPKKKNQQIRFIHVSTLDERHKNISGILTACALLKAEKGPSFSMSIISDEPYDQWQEAVKQAGLSDCVSFAGPMHPEEVAAAIQEADAFVLFSRYETFSIVIAEAWSTGTPVISTPVGIAGDLDPSCGIRVRINDPESLKSAMKQFVERSVSFNHNAISGKASPYGPAQVLETIDRLYRKLIAGEA